ncbi:MAG: M1 family aminopeptidase, partial [Candidatus Hodarchaeota archaeon]
GFYGGMEYPCQVLISESLDRQHSDNPEFWFELIVVHETAHQWWSQLVGNDQIDCGHLDEGLVCWSTDYYFDYYNPDWNQFNPYWPLDIVRTYYKEYYQPGKVNQSAYNFADTNMSYRFTAYQKAPLILQKLRTVINHDNFMAGLRYFYEKYKFKIATLPNLQKAFEAVTDISLDWFFLPWFDNPYLPNYNFKDVDYDVNQGAMTVTIEDLNEDKNDYPYAQQIYLQVTDIRQFGIFYYKQVWINGTTTLSFKLDIKGTPGAIQLVYGSDVLVQLKSGEEAVLTYNDYSWYNTNPKFSWVPFKGGDWIEWNFKIHYSDSKNIIDSLTSNGKLKCEILSISKSTSTLNLVTNLIFTPTIELLQQFNGRFIFKMDHEGHAFPYYILLFSPFVGNDFQFTQEWIDSLRYLDDFQLLQADIKDEGKSITMQITADSGNFNVDVRYNSEGLLALLDVQFDTFTPAGPEGPELNGQLIFELYTSSFKSYRPETAELVELALIPTTLSIIFAYVVWFIRKKHNQEN